MTWPSLAAAVGTAPVGAALLPVVLEVAPGVQPDSTMVAAAAQPTIPVRTDDLGRNMFRSPLCDCSVSAR